MRWAQEEELRLGPALKGMGRGVPRGRAPAHLPGGVHTNSRKKVEMPLHAICITCYYKKYVCYSLKYVMHIPMPGHRFKHAGWCQLTQKATGRDLAVERTAKNMRSLRQLWLGWLSWDVTSGR